MIQSIVYNMIPFKWQTFKRFINIILIWKTYKSIRIRVRFIFSFLSFLLSLTPLSAFWLKYLGQYTENFSPHRCWMQNKTDWGLYLGVGMVGEDCRKLRHSYPWELFSSRYTLEEFKPNNSKSPILQGMIVIYIFNKMLIFFKWVTNYNKANTTQAKKKNHQSNLSKFF